MVTGTTASSGDHSNITGRAATPVRSPASLAKIFGVARLGETRAVEHVLRDRIGNDGRCSTGGYVGHCPANGCERCRRARLVGAAGLGGDRKPDVDDGQGGLESCAGPRRLDHGDRQPRRDTLATPHQELRIG